MVPRMDNGMKQYVGRYVNLLNYRKQVTERIWLLCTLQGTSMYFSEQ